MILFFKKRYWIYVDFSAWLIRTHEKIKPFISINVPFFSIVLVLIWISWFHVWIFICIKINLGYWHTHTTNENRSTKYRFVKHSFTTSTCICIHLFMSFVFQSIFICVSCVKYLYSPKICNETNKKAKPTISSRQNGKFYFQTKIQPHLTSTQFFFIEISTWEFFEIALYFSHEMFSMRCSILPFFMYKLFFYFNVNVGL